jgi:hypothetical protein
LRYNPALLWSIDVKYKIQKNTFRFGELPIEMRDMSLMKRAERHGYITKQKKGLYKVSVGKVKL